MATMQMSGSSTKENPPWPAGRVEHSGGELGIRTPDSLRGNTRLAGEHLRPLGQLSKFGALESYLTNARGHKG